MNIIHYFYVNISTFALTLISFIICPVSLKLQHLNVERCHHGTGRVLICSLSSVKLLHVSYFLFQHTLDWLLLVKESVGWVPTSLWWMPVYWQGSMPHTPTERSFDINFLRCGGKTKCWKEAHELCCGLSFTSTGSLPFVVLSRSTVTKNMYKYSTRAPWKLNFP